MAITVAITSHGRVMFGPERKVTDPKAMWFAHHVLFGDLSGGGVNINFVFQDPNEVMSCEAVALECSVNSSKSYQLAIIEPTVNALPASLVWISHITGGGFMTDDGHPKFTYGMGVPFRINPNAAVDFFQVSTAYGTNTNGATYRSLAWGFLWDKDVFNKGMPTKPGW